VMGKIEHLYSARMAAEIRRKKYKQQTNKQ